ncbi:MAG: ORF6N domain-containing protein [Kiritimatiellaeota bacterium]|nr:ORF6N domain-containing protein [Kiritimatiellota bacterium]
MKSTISLTQVEDKLITIKGQSVLLDSDVAALYAVETREVNQAILRNPDKFPKGYIIQLNKAEWESLRSQIVTLNEGKQTELITNCDKFSSKNLKSQIVTSSWGGKNKFPKAFTEKGLYMLATILKGKRAAQTTIAIVEAFAKIRELARTVAKLSATNEKFQQQSLMQKGGEIMSDILGDDMKTTDTETSIELNFAVLKFKHTVKRKND